MALLGRKESPAEMRLVKWTYVVAEPFWHDDRRFLKEGMLVRRDDPALLQNPQFFKRVLSEEV